MSEITNADIANMSPDERLALAASEVARPEVLPGGTVVASGAPAVDRMRVIVILQALKLEADTGMKMTSRKKAPSPLTIVRKEFGIKAKTTRDAYIKFRAKMIEHGVIQDDPRLLLKDEKPGA